MFLSKQGLGDAAVVAGSSGAGSAVLPAQEPSLGEGAVWISLILEEG
jgi:hypothetical protein